MQGEHNMQQYRIELEYEGVDLEDFEVAARLCAVPSFLWSRSNGVTIVSASQYAANGIDAAGIVRATIADALRGVAPNARPTRMKPDLVNTADIAERAGVSRETPRLWAEARRGPGSFPRPHTIVGRSNVWVWSEVHQWLRSHYRLGENIAYPTEVEAARINTRCLSNLWEAPSSRRSAEWTSVRHQQTSVRSTHSAPHEVTWVAGGRSA